ncbi:hypothetical protein [Dishui Lake large algae virus 1]|nr:hypothetical protein [Dishui Lake large algae virus 1]
MSSIEHTDDWIDVSEKRAEHIDTGDIPSKDELDQLSPKDTVKISNGFEKFFVTVREVSDDIVIGTIDNHLVGKYDYDYGDMVRFEKKNVFLIKKSKIPDANAVSKRRSARRMMRLLGIDPKNQNQNQNNEALALMSIISTKL